MRFPHDINGSLPVHQALEMLNRLCPNDVISIANETACTVKSSRRLLKQLDVLNMESHLLYTAFYGGPVGKESWWHGNLRMFLLDVLMRQEVECNEAKLPGSLTREIVATFKRKHRRRKKKDNADIRVSMR